MKLRRSSIVGAAIMGVGVVLAVTFGGSYASKYGAERNASTLLAEGDRVEATVVRTFDITSCGGVVAGRSSGCATTHYVDYELVDENGALRKGTAKNIPIDRERYALAETFVVLVDQARPNNFMPEYRANRFAIEKRNVGWTLIIPAVLMSVGALLLIAPRRKAESATGEVVLAKPVAEAKAFSTVEIVIIAIGVAVIALMVWQLANGILSAGI